MLSQFRIEGDGSVARRSCKRDCTRFNSMVVEATTWYSISIEECAIVPSLFKHTKSSFYQDIEQRQ